MWRFFFKKIFFSTRERNSRIHSDSSRLAFNSSAHQIRGNPTADCTALNSLRQHSFLFDTCDCIASPVSGFALNLEDRFGTVVLNPWIAASLKVRLGRGFWFNYVRLYNCWDENFGKNCRFIMFLWLLKIRAPDDD